MNKTNNLTRTLLTSVLLISAARAASLLLFSLIAYLTDDPGSNVFMCAIACKAVSDALCGFITARALGKDFSLSTRVFFALFAVTLLNVIELLIGRLIFPSQGTALYILPVSVLSAFAGSFFAYGKKAKRRHTRKRKQRTK